MLVILEILSKSAPLFFLKSMHRDDSYKLFVKGFDFTKCYIGGKTIQWVCSQKNMSQCRARVAMSRKDGTVWITNGIHNHLGKPIENYARSYKFVTISSVMIEKIAKK